MLIYKGGQKTGKGTYWDMVNGRRVDVLKEEILPGARRCIYLRIPPFVMLLLAPILGLFYVVFLPVASVVLTVVLSVQKLWRWMIGLVRRLAYFEWRPSEAYLSGKKKPRKRESRSDDEPKPG